MSEVRQTFTSDVSKLEADLAKLQGQYLKVKERLGEIAEESRRGAAGHQQWAGEALGLIGNVSGMAISVGGAFSGLVASTRALTDETRNTRKETADLNQELLRNLSLRGRASVGKEVKEWAATMAQRTGLTEEQLERSFVAATEGAPQSPLDIQKAIALTAAMRAPMAGTEGAATTAREMGYLISIMPERTPEQIRSVNEYLSQQLPVNVRNSITSRETLRGLGEAVRGGAATPEEALGLVTALGKREVSPDVMGKVIQTIYEPIERPNVLTGHRPTEEQEAQIALAEMTPRQRLQAIFSNPELRMKLLGMRLSRQLVNITPDEIQESVKGIGEAEQTDLTAKELAALPDQSYREQYKKYAEDQRRIALNNSAFGEFIKDQEDDLRRQKEEGTYMPVLSEGLQMVDTFVATQLAVGDTMKVPARVLPSEKAMRSVYSRGNLELEPGMAAYGGGRESPTGVVRLPTFATGRDDMNNTFSGPAAPKDQAIVEELRGLRRELFSNQATNAAAAARQNGRE